MLSVGIIEKDGGTLYCSSVLIGKDGELLIRRRKVSRGNCDITHALTILQLIPTAAERLVWGRGAGDGLQVVNTEYGKMGGFIW